MVNVSVYFRDVCISVSVCIYTYSRSVDIDKSIFTRVCVEGVEGVWYVCKSTIPKCISSVTKFSLGRQTLYFTTWISIIM
jgi:hypothetical protein